MNNNIVRNAFMLTLLVAAMTLEAATWYDERTGYTWTYSAYKGNATIYADPESGSGYSTGHSGVTGRTAISPKPTGALTIPTMIDGNRVTGIGAFAFADCSGLTSVAIPSSVTRIGAGAFFNCSGLTCFNVPDGVTEISEEAFNGCSSLSIVTIPDGVVRIDTAAFKRCTNLKGVIIPNSVTAIGMLAFFGSGLTSVTIPDCVSEVGNEAFCDCSSLTNATILSNYVFIGPDAFGGCNELLYDTSTIYGVKLVDGWAVGYSVSSFGNLNLNGVRGISANAFKGCRIGNVSIPISVKSIGFGAFDWCNFDTSTIPGVRLVDGWVIDVDRADSLSGDLNLNGVRGIAHSSFWGCDSLTSVTIPSSVERIDINTFSYCSSLTNVIISEGVTSIGVEAFFGCGSLTSLTIPSSVTSIESSAFVCCYNLSSVVFDGNAPSLGFYTPFDSDCTLYVKSGSTGWGVEIPGTWNGLRIEYLEEEPQTHIVTFDLGDHGIRIGEGELTQTVTNGYAAVAPEIAATNGWAFAGWSTPFTNVTANLTVTAQYEKLPERVDYYVYGGGSALQRVIDIAANGSTILVGDGTYAPIDTSDKTLTIRSVNGPEKTFITGRGGRCALLGVIRDNCEPYSVFDFYVESFGTALEGFTLKNGSSSLSAYIDAIGGGVAGGVLCDCKIVSCTAYLGGGAFQSSLIRCEIRSCWTDSYDDFYQEPMHEGMGGGAYDCSLYNCLIHQCSADGDAGGGIYCDVFSCTIVDNDLASGGSVRISELETGYTGGVSAGINFCNVSNSIVWGNVEYVAVHDDNWNPVLDEYGYVQIRERWNDCYFIGENGGERKGFFVGNCIYSIPSNWLSSFAPVIQNNIADDPQFVDAEHGNYRLLPTSPCIDAAGWAATNAVIDLDGKPRVSGIAPDIGAYEYQYVVSPIPELAASATPAEVSMALSGSTDDNLVANVTNAAQYAAYRDWALAVKNEEGTSVAGAQKVKDSPRAWLAFALGTDRLVPDVLTSDDIKIESFEPRAEDGKFAFEVSIADVGIGEGVTITDANRDAIIGNIKKVLGVEGAAMLGESAFSSDNIEITFDTPVEGKARFTVTLPIDAGGSFFMRVKVK